MLKNNIINITFIITVILTILAIDIGYNYFKTAIRENSINLNKKILDNILIMEYKDRNNSEVTISLQQADIDSYSGKYPRNHFAGIGRHFLSVVTPGMDKWGINLYIINRNFNELFHSLPMEKGNFFIPPDYETVEPGIILSYPLYSQLKRNNPEVNYLGVNGKKINVRGVIANSFFNFILGKNEQLYALITANQYADIFRAKLEDIGYEYLLSSRLTTQDTLVYGMQLFSFFDNEITHNKITTIHKVDTLYRRSVTTNQSLFISILILQLVLFSSILIGIMNISNLVTANSALQRKNIVIKQVIGCSFKYALTESITEYLILMLSGGILGYLVQAAANNLFNLFFKDTLNSLYENISFLLILAACLLCGIVLGVIHSISRNKADIIEVIGQDF